MIQHLMPQITTFNGLVPNDMGKTTKRHAIGQNYEPDFYLASQGRQSLKVIMIDSAQINSCPNCDHRVW
jgi:hypothetical protein